MLGFELKHNAGYVDSGPTLEKVSNGDVSWVFVPMQTSVDRMLFDADTVVLVMLLATHFLTWSWRLGWVGGSSVCKLFVTSQWKSSDKLSRKIKIDIESRFGFLGIWLVESYDVAIVGLSDLHRLDVWILHRARQIRLLCLGVTVTVNVSVSLTDSVVTHPRKWYCLKLSSRGEKKGTVLKSVSVLERSWDCFLQLQGILKFWEWQ